MLTTAALVLLAVSGRSIPLLVAAHVVLSVGLALLFTPLFSSGLGALPPELYSHGSAMVGAVQQVAGAAGIAALVSVMTIRSGALMAAGAEPAAALSGGLHAAFWLGAAVSVLAVVGVFFVKRPPMGAGGHGH
jgi:DHA2 family lincomycin resistance protein-like MFS transporter